MSRAKNIQYLKGENFLETQWNIIYEIKSETLLKIGIFLNKYGIYYNNDLITFLNNPLNYHGDPNNLPLIVDKFLKDIISKYYRMIQEHNLPIKSVYDIIFNEIFRGKK
ncbi:MAG: hypothetical protein ACFFDF_08010 [Candidatus Odinarchaeota archaeon]